MIKIYTVQFNDPEFLHYQQVTFKRFLKEEHQIVCINNSYDKPHEKQAISDKARELGIECHIPQGVDHSKGGFSHQSALNWTWRKFIAGNDKDTTIILDHDMFLIRDLVCSLDYDITSIMQGRGGHIRYFHPGFMIIHPQLKDKRTVDFKGEYIDGLACDSGGNWHHYIKTHPDLKIKDLLMVNVCSEHENLGILPTVALEGYNEADPFQIIEDNILHFRNGSNWAWTENKAYLRKKEQLRQTLDHYINL